MRSLSPFVLAFVVAVCACSCSSKKDAEPEAVEIPTTSAPLDDAPERELFQRAKEQYSSGLFIVAKDSFQSLRDAYPLGPYTQFAEIKLADSEFELRRYPEAALQYEELVKLHPTSPSLPYLLFMAGRANQLASRGVGRDTEPLQKANTFFSRLLEEYPHSRYRTAAIRHLGKVRTQIALNEKEILEFYKRQEKQAAYEARLAAFHERWGANAFQRLARNEAPVLEFELASAEPLDPPGLLAVSRPAELQPPRILAAVDTNEMRASLRHTTTLEEAELAFQVADERETESAELNEGMLQIWQVECKDAGDDRLVVIHLSDLPTQVRELVDGQEFSGGEGWAIPLRVPVADGSFSCGGITVTGEDEAITLSGVTGSHRVLALEHPARLILQLSDQG